MMKKKASNNQLGIEDEAYDFNSISFMEPNPEKPILYANSRDYVVILHLNDEIKNLIVQTRLDDQNVQELFAKHNAEQRKKTKAKDLSDALDGSVRGAIGDTKQTVVPQRAKKGISDLFGDGGGLQKDNKKASTTTIVPKKTSKFIFNDLVQHGQGTSDLKKPSIDDLLPSKNLSSPEKPVLTQKIKDDEKLLKPTPQKLLESQLSHPTIPGEPDIQFSKKYAPSPRKVDNDASKTGNISNPEAFNSQKSHRKFN